MLTKPFNEINSLDCRYGEMMFRTDDSYIGRSLAAYGEYSDLEAALWAKIIQPNWRVVEVGANIGALTLALAEMVPSGGVMAFEPQPENFELLKINVEQNHLGNTSVHQLAFGNRTGKIRVPRLASLKHSNFGAVEIGQGEEEVEISTVDNLTMGRVDFIKIDVEGMEGEVLAGAVETIKRCRPILYVEIDRANKRDALIKQVRNMGYRCYEHLPPLFNPDNFRGEMKNVFGEVVSVNMLCVPDEKMDQFREATDELRPLIPASSTVSSAGKSTGWACVARCGGIGDNLIAASVLMPLRKQGFKVEVISQPPQHVVWENNPFVDKLTVREAKDWPQGDAWHNWFRDRAKEYDRFIHLSHSVEIAKAAFPAMSSFWWPASVRRKLFAGSYLELAHDIAEVPYEFGPLFWATDEEIDAAVAVKRRLGSGPIICWCICGTRVDKVYPQAPQVIGRMIKELGVQVVMIGAPPPHPDYPIAKQVQEMIVTQNGSDKGLHHAASSHPGGDQWSIRRLLTLASVCDLVIGPDTGPMWGVAMEPVPKIMLHSHASEENITKHWVNTVSLHADQKKVPCWPCHRLHDTTDTCVLNQWGNGAACISSIEPDTLIGAVQDQLKLI